MSNPMEPRKPEYASTYFVPDRNSQEELQRLTVQDQMLTVGMGGALSEQAEPTVLHRVLDIACGTGGWAIQAARTYPEMSLVGVDISKPMVEFARAEAEAQGVGERVEYRVMDATMIIEMPPASFDLVNLRLGVSFLRTWEWPKILEEMQRVTRPQGIIRVTEAVFPHSTTSSTLRQVQEVFQHAFFRAGNLFADETTGLTAHLPAIFTRHGIQNVQTKAHDIVLRAGTPEGQLYARDMEYLFQTGRPFLQRRGHLPKDYDTLCQQAVFEMQRADFSGTWTLLTIWGNKPKRRRVVRENGILSTGTHVP